MKKYFFLFFLFFVLFFPSVAGAFKAEVLEVVKEEEKMREGGSVYRQQDLKLRGLDDSYKNQEFFYYGVSEIEVANAHNYKKGDKVLVDELEGVFYITDFVRSSYLYLLALIFLFVVLLVGRIKGLRALLGLILSFFVIIKFILPQILAGRDPFLTSLVGCFLILGIIIYLSEGWNKKSHLSILAVLISLSVTLLLSLIFTKLNRLSGLGEEEAVFLISLGQAQINFQGLLLAGMLIGAVGVLDDIIIGQVEAVRQLSLTNPQLKRKKLFIMASKIGNSHLGAIINTLFLTYAGAALPLLLIFLINQEQGLGWQYLLNNELVATEIVRTLVGSIGVILAMPIASYLAARAYEKKK